MKFATISSKGQIIIPKELRAKYHLEMGTQLVFEETRKGILIRAIDKGFLNSLIEDISNDDVKPLGQ
jgi:AbrB family looped-hinge helix DNA binding protein